MTYTYTKTSIRHFKMIKVPIILNSDEPDSACDISLLKSSLMNQS